MSRRVDFVTIVTLAGVWLDSIHYEFRIGSITNANNIYTTAMGIVKPFSKKVLQREYNFMKEDFGFVLLVLQVTNTLIRRRLY